MNEEYDKLILKLNENIQKVVLSYKEEKKKNNELSEKIGDLNKELNIYIGKYQELEQKYNNLKLAKVMVKMEDEEKDAKIKLNKIIREIDDCIALLNK